MTIQTSLNRATPDTLPDMLRRLNFGNVLAAIGGATEMSDGAGFDVVASTIVFTDPVLAILALGASVGGNNNAVVLVPDGSAVAATASGGVPPAVHTGVVSYDAQGRITTVTFSGAPTLVFATVVPAPASLVENLALSEVA